MFRLRFYQHLRCSRLSSQIILCIVIIFITSPSDLCNHLPFFSPRITHPPFHSYAPNLESPPFRPSSVRELVYLPCTPNVTRTHYSTIRHNNYCTEYIPFSELFAVHINTAYQQRNMTYQCNMLCNIGTIWRQGIGSQFLF